MSAKKIGFVDLYISEWHANNYPVWMNDICQKLGYAYKVAYAYAERDISPVDGRSTDEWCSKYGVEKCAAIDELCEKSDVIVVLAPSNPETHLRYAEAVFKYGKPTYIDKTFAPDATVSAKIFALAEKYGTPFFSTSALRYGEELDAVEAPTTVVTTGGGRSAEEYIVHQIEMVVKKLGIGATAVRASEVSGATCFHIRYADERAAQMTYSAGALPFTVYMMGESGSVLRNVESDYFKSLMKDILVFFETGRISFDVAETHEVMKIREAALKAMTAPDRWVEINNACSSELKNTVSHYIRRVGACSRR